MSSIKGRTSILLVEEVAKHNSTVALGLKLGKAKGMRTVEILESILYMMDKEQQDVMTALKPMLDRAKEYKAKKDAKQ